MTLYCSAAYQLEASGQSANYVDREMAIGIRVA